MPGSQSNKVVLKRAGPWTGLLFRAQGEDEQTRKMVCLWGYDWNQVRRQETAREVRVGKRITHPPRRAGACHSLQAGRRARQGKDRRVGVQSLRQAVHVEHAAVQGKRAVHVSQPRGRTAHKGRKYCCERSCLAWEAAKCALGGRRENKGGVSCMSSTLRHREGA